MSRSFATEPYYFTTAGNHAGGSGYWTVMAIDAAEAREKMHTYFGVKWAFQYDDLDLIHPLDQEKHHGTIN